jgi:acyl carrier protein
MKEQLNKIFQQAFGVDRIKDSMSIDNVDGWDSMAHVGLIMELQKTFKVSIPPADAVELTSVKKIIEYLKRNAKKISRRQ